MNRKRQSIGRDAAIALAEKQWWKGKTSREIAEFQMLTDELCCPFGVFHKALEAALGRSVWTHELALSNGIMGELFDGNEAPSFGDILALIPAEKLIVIGGGQ